MVEDRNAELVLACLRCQPDLRLIHQQPCPPDDDGHIVFPESVFFETRNPLGLKPPGGKLTFRRLLKGGWLTLVESHGSPAVGARLSYGLSPGATERFERDPAWQRSEDVFREVCGLPKVVRLSIVEGGRA